MSVFNWQESGLAAAVRHHRSVSCAVVYGPRPEGEAGGWSKDLLICWGETSELCEMSSSATHQWILMCGVNYHETSRVTCLIHHSGLLESPHLGHFTQNFYSHVQWWNLRCPVNVNCLLMKDVIVSSPSDRLGLKAAQLSLFLQTLCSVLKHRATALHVSKQADRLTLQPQPLSCTEALALLHCWASSSHNTELLTQIQALSEKHKVKEVMGECF